MLLRVSSDPPQSVNAGFELKGSPMAGLLVLTGPLGNIAATLQWNAEGATLHRAGEAGQTFASLDALAQQATGTAFPIAALFDWLGGRPWPAAAAHPLPDGAAGFAQMGWQVALQRIADGLVVLSRTDPAPIVTVRIKLDAR